MVGPSDGLELLRESVIVLDRHPARLGAIAIERRAREELAATGARPRRRRLTGPAALTPSERRVAELAAGGASNREIAQGLFVSLRTVETHLTSTYRKLRIDTRAELVESGIAPPGGRDRGTTIVP